jgi:EAL domain-containing protein (putative c-di-GMP-specific phosphodiesterase class I)
MMSDALPRQIFPAGAQIFAKGDAGNFAYVIETGNVEMTTSRNGRKVVLARFRDGDLLGESALVDDEPRAATAVAVEETQVVVLDKQTLREQVANSDETVQLLLRLTLERLRSLEQLVVSQGSAGASGRRVTDHGGKAHELVQDLQGAIEGEALSLHYQPIVHLSSGRIAGFEALVRWNHPVHGNVVPSSFIKLAEETGMIVPMGRWMLRKALDAHQRFQSTAAGKSPEEQPLYISVNISSRQLLTDGEVDDLCNIIKASGVPSEQVLFEITESLMVEEPDKVADAMRRLHKQGVHIAADDFGTGYANLSFLNRFPLDVLKIDRTFITNMASEDRSRKIVRTIVRLAQELGMSIIAEGIEAPQEIEVLRELGCDFGQGFLLSPPVPGAEATTLLKRRVRW